MEATEARLAPRPGGEPGGGTYSFTRSPVPSPAEGQVLLRVVYLSLDPYMRGRMSAAESYAAPVGIGDVLVGGTVCEVLESRHDAFAPGELVVSYSGWQTHAVSDGSGLRKVDPSAAPVSTALGV